MRGSRTRGLRANHAPELGIARRPFLSFGFDTLHCRLDQKQTRSAVGEALLRESERVLVTDRVRAALRGVVRALLRRFRPMRVHVTAIVRIRVYEWATAQVGAN